MNGRIGVMIAVGCLSLAACGERQTVRGEDGETAVIAHGNAAASAPGVDLPSFLPIYPGGRVESSIGGVSSAASGSQKGGMVIFLTPVAPDRVTAFYRERLDGSGLTDRAEANLNGIVILTATSQDDSDRGVQVHVASEGAGSRVTLVYSNGDA